MVGGDAKQGWNAMTLSRRWPDLHYFENPDKPMTGSLSSRTVEQVDGDGIVAPEESL